MRPLPNLSDGCSGMRAVCFSKRLFAHRMAMALEDFLFNASVPARYTSVRIAYP
jgi:hypothetical protein